MPHDLDFVSLVTASVILAVARHLGRAAQPTAGGTSEIEGDKLQLADLDREQELKTSAMRKLSR